MSPLAVIQGVLLAALAIAALLHSFDGALAALDLWLVLQIMKVVR